MTLLEFVADRLRHEWHRGQRVADPLSWGMLQPCEQHRWITLARVALDADAAWHESHL